MIRLREISVQLNIRVCFFRTLIERIWRILQVCGTCFIKGKILVPWQDKGDLRRILVWGQVWEEKVYPHTYPHHWNPDKQGVSDGLWGCEGNKIKKVFLEVDKLTSWQGILNCITLNLRGTKLRMRSFSRWWTLYPFTIGRFTIFNVWTHCCPV